MPRIIAEVKQVMASLLCYDNSDVIATLIMTHFHLNTTVVAIFPNAGLWRHSLYSNLVLTQPSPQAFSARSILDSTVSCDVTERYTPRYTPVLSPALSQTSRGQRGKRERLGTRLVLTLKTNCIKPSSYASTAYVVVIRPSFLSYSFVKIWATCEIFLGKQFTAPPGQKFPLRLEQGTSQLNAGPPCRSESTLVM